MYHRGLSVSTLVSVDAQGVVTPLALEPRAYAHPRWSPDGRQIAVAIARSGGTDVWLIDVRAASLRKLTPPEGSADSPEWSGDGKHILYRHRMPTGTTIRQISADGGATSVVIDSVVDPYGARWSADGQWITLVATRGIVAGVPDLAYAHVGGSTKPTFISPGIGWKYTPALSPDNRWLLYVGTKSGRAETYLGPFPPTGTFAQISPEGGNEVLWGRDGHSVFYRRGRNVMTAQLAFSPAPKVAAITTLFTGDFLSDPGYGQWDVSADGKHFLMLQNADSREETVLIYNWADELRRAWK